MGTFTLKQIRDATNDFSPHKKIGEVGDILELLQNSKNMNFSTYFRF